MKTFLIPVYLVNSDHGLILETPSSDEAKAAEAEYRDERGWWGVEIAVLFIAKNT